CPRYSRSPRRATHSPTTFPYTTLFRSALTREEQDALALASQTRVARARAEGRFADEIVPVTVPATRRTPERTVDTDEHHHHEHRSEEHTSELQSRENLVCRLLLEKKNN